MKSHHEELYPQYHHVMSRRRLSVDREKPRKGKVITHEAFTALPTIKDIEEDSTSTAPAELRYLFLATGVARVALGKIFFIPSF